MFKRKKIIFIILVFLFFNSFQALSYLEYEKTNNLLGNQKLTYISTLSLTFPLEVFVKNNNYLESVLAGEEIKNSLVDIPESTIDREIFYHNNFYKPLIVFQLSDYETEFKKYNIYNYYN